MTDRKDTSPIEETDDSRRSFMKKGALATGALALGSSAVGTGAAQQTTDGGQTPEDETPQAQGADHVLMLHPDAVEDAEFTVVSGQLDWNPIGGGQAGTTTPGVGEAPTPDIEGAEDYRTHVIQYGFSASHVAHAFVPADADVEENGDYQFGEIQEIVEQPGQGGSGVLEGEPTYVRVALETGGADGGGTETPAETPAETATETPTEDGGGGLFG